MITRIPRRFLRLTLAVVVCVFLYAFIWTNLPLLQFSRNWMDPFSDHLPMGKMTNSKAGSVTAQNKTNKAAQMEDKHQDFTKNLPQVKSSKYIPNDKQISFTTGTNMLTGIIPTNKTNPSFTKILTSKVATNKVYRTPAGIIASGGTKKDLTTSITPLAPLDINGFKTAPQWDFEDMYLRDPHPRNTTCAQSLRNSKDQEFKKSFLPDIQLFMQKDHLNLSVWNRLAHFNNPFGFMGYNYSVVQESVSLIPDLKDYQLLPVPLTEKEGCIRCAVVGTGGILNGSKMGKEIDSHDYVFRMNGAVLKGYEEDVGSKTSVYVHTAHSLTSVVHTLKKYGFKNIPNDQTDHCRTIMTHQELCCFISKIEGFDPSNDMNLYPQIQGIKYVFIPEGLRDFYWLQGLLRKTKVPGGQFRNFRPQPYYPSEFDVKRFYVLHPDFLRYVRIRFMLSKQLHGKHWKYYRPTNGAFTLFLALHTCDIVDAYGFITANHSKYPNYYYDRSAKTKVIFFINHDYNLEIKTWKKLHDTNIMKLYQGKEDSHKNGDKR